MIWRVLNVEGWAELRRLHRSDGMAIKAIARVLGVPKVRRALRAPEPPSSTSARR
jgi:hypothetical protein